MTGASQLSDRDLVSGYGNACLAAGKSNCGLSINPAAQDDWEVMLKWKEALLQRLKDLRVNPNLSNVEGR